MTQRRDVFRLAAGVALAPLAPLPAPAAAGPEVRAMIAVMVVTAGADGPEFGDTVVATVDWAKIGGRWTPSLTPELTAGLDTTQAWLASLAHGREG